MELKTLDENLKGINNMKYLFVFVAMVLSASAFAENLTPGEYRDAGSIRKILYGLYDNLIDKKCALKILDATENRINFALGAKLIGLRVEVTSASDNGPLFYLISPELDHTPTGQSVLARCYFRNP